MYGENPTQSEEAIASEIKEDKEQQTYEQQPIAKMDRLKWGFAFCSTALGVIGGIYSLYQLYLTWIFEIEERFEVLMIRRKW